MIMIAATPIIMTGTVMSLYQYFSPDVKLDSFGVLSFKVQSTTIIEVNKQ